MEEQVVINARVANRFYKIKVEPTHEGFVREQLNQIADKLHQFKLSFPGRDEQDYMAMVLLDHITKTSGTDTGNDLASFEKELEKLSNLLDQ